MAKTKIFLCMIFVLVLTSFVGLVSAQENRTPIFIGIPTIPSSIMEGELHTFGIQVQDPDGDPVTIEWYLDSELVSSVIKYDSTNSSFGVRDEYDFFAVSAGVYLIEIIISDGELDNSIGFNVNVADSPDVGGRGGVRVMQPLYDCRELDVENMGYRLQNDITTNGTCFVVRANNIVLDLNGHSITGDKRGHAIRINNYDLLTVKNGVISNFSDGIEISNSNDNLIENINFEYNDKGEAGILIDNSNNNLIQNNSFNLNDGGIYIEGGSNNTIIDNVVTNSWENGIQVFSSNNNILKNNLIENNDGDGIYIGGTSSSNIIEDNKIYDNYRGIIFHDETNSNTVKNNEIHGGGVGIGLSGYNTSLNLLEYNEIHNVGVGISIGGSHTNSNILKDNILYANEYSGIVITGGATNTIENNKIYENKYYGILFEGILIEYFDSNTIYNNFFNNTQNVKISDDSSTIVNYWNSTSKGNYWANPDGTGFSQTCDDLDRDGICDSSYELGEGNVDYLPLTTTCDVSDTLEHLSARTYTSPEGISYQIGLGVIEDASTAQFRVNGEWTPDLQEGETYIFLDGSKISLINVIYQHIPKAIFCFSYPLADTTPPEINILAPEDGSTIKGDYTSLVVETNEDAVCEYNLKKVISHAEEELTDDANLGGVEDSALGGSSIVLDSQDNWHITYYDSHTIKYINSLSDEIIDIAQNADTHSFAIDSNDNLHLVYFVNGHSIMYINNVEGEWSIPEEILSGVNPSGYPHGTIGISLAIDSENNWHIVYYDWYKIKYMNSFSSSAITLASGEVAGPDMTIDSNNKLHVVYYIVNGGSRWYEDGYSVRYRNNVEGDWSTDQELTNFIPENISSSDVSISINSEENWHLVYRVDSALYYLNGKLDNPELLTTNGQRPRISVDSNDIAHMVYFSGIHSVIYKKMDDYITLISKEMEITGEHFHMQQIENLEETQEGEKYTIKVTCTDESGNSAEAEIEFYVDLSELKEIMILEDIGDYEYQKSTMIEIPEGEDEEITAMYYAYYDKSDDDYIYSAGILESQDESYFNGFLDEFDEGISITTEIISGYNVYRLDEGDGDYGIFWFHENLMVYVMAAIHPGDGMISETPLPIVEAYLEKYPSDLIIDTTAPTIILLGPRDDYTKRTSKSSYEINFKFKVSDESEIAYCELIIDGDVEETKTDIQKDMGYLFSVKLDRGSYDWQIKCVDSEGNEGFSEVRDLKIKKKSSSGNDDIRIIDYSYPYYETIETTSPINNVIEELEVITLNPKTPEESKGFFESIWDWIKNLFFG